MEGFGGSGAATKAEVKGDLKLAEVPEVALHLEIVQAFQTDQDQWRTTPFVQEVSLTVDC